MEQPALAVADLPLANPVPTGLRLGPYEILSPVAPSGERGVVLAASEARPTGRPRRVALTVVDPGGMSEQTRAALLDRWTIAAELSHPSLVPALDSGQIGESLFVASPWLDGWDLDAILRRCHEVGELPSPRQVASLGLELAEALAFVHELRDDAGQPLGLIHGRIGVPRVMLMNSGHVKLLGFPGPPATSKSLASQPQDLRTTAFLAPEQLRGAEPDARTDIYALSVLLATLLLGTNPLLRGTREATHEAIRDGLTLPPGIDPALRTILQRGLCVVPEDRPHTARWLAINLGHRLSAGLGGPLQPGEWRAMLHDMFPVGEEVDDTARREAAVLFTSMLPSMERWGVLSHATPASPPPLREPAPERRREWTRAAWVLGAAVLALVVLVLGVRGARLTFQSTAEGTAPTSVAEAETRPGVGALLEEAERHLADHRYAAAVEVVQRATLAGTAGPVETERLARLRDAATHEMDLAAVRRLIDLGSLVPARTRASELLVADPADAEVAALIARIDEALAAPGPVRVRRPTAARPTARPAVAPTAMGFLVIESTPTAVAYVDGAPVGTTPVRRVEVSPGPHDVVLRLAGHREVQRRVDVAAGATTRLAEDLEVTRATPATGTLTIRSTPPAVVFVDGTPVGTTPLSGHALPAGEHRIELRSGGHGSETRTVTMAAGANAELEVTLHPVAGAATGGSP